MITLLGSLLGLVGSALPQFLKYFKDREERLHEREMLKLKAENESVSHTQRIEEIQIQAESAANIRLYDFAPAQKNHWSETLASSVRPVLTYAFFFLYAGVKVGKLWMAHTIYPTASWGALLVGIWHGEDQSIFATVLAFWFGQRTFRNPKR